MPAKAKIQRLVVTPAGPSNFPMAPGERRNDYNVTMTFVTNDPDFVRRLVAMVEPEYEQRAPLPLPGGPSRLPLKDR